MSSFVVDKTSSTIDSTDSKKATVCSELLLLEKHTNSCPYCFCASIVTTFDSMPRHTKKSSKAHGQPHQHVASAGNKFVILVSSDHETDDASLHVSDDEDDPKVVHIDGDAEAEANPPKSTRPPVDLKQIG